MQDIKIGKHIIGETHKPFIIAEMSGNHNQSLERALKIIDVAAQSGADAVKIQTYTPDTMTINLSQNEFFIKDPKSLWSGKSLYELYSEAATPWEWHEPMFKKANDLGILIFSTPFDFTSVDFLEKIGVPCYKIASFENTDLPLIRRVIKTGKPLIISTGMASIVELGETVHTARSGGCKDLVLLKCTSSYPSSPVYTNLRTIPHMRDLFQCQVGLSDHTLGCGVSVGSVALGATVIEKHFTLSRAEGGVDSAFSMEPDEFSTLVKETHNAWLALGNISYGLTKEEEKSLVYRRSLYITEDIQEGQVFSSQNLRAIRPGLGLPPKFIELFIGKKSSVPIKRGTPLSWDMLGN